MARAQPLEVFSARDLRNRSGELFRNAADGRLALITKHGRPAILAIPFHEELLQQGIHRSLAISLFESGNMTTAQCAKLAGMTLGEFIDLLGELGIPAVDYPPEELESELEAAL